MKLELKHLSPYLPYGLKYVQYDAFSRNTPKGTIETMACDNIESVISYYEKPILRPLSDLTKEIEVKGEKFVPVDRLFGSAYRISGFEHCINKFNGGFELTMNGVSKTIYADFNMYQKLFEWHFDVFVLIEKGLAIDINSLT